MTAVDLFANQAATVVSSGGLTAPSPGTSETWMAASPGNFTVTADPTASPATQFRVIDPVLPSEIMIVTDSRTSSWAVTRGAEGTAPAAHAAGFSVEQVITAGALASLLQTGSGSAGGDYDGGSPAGGNYPVADYDGGSPLGGNYPVLTIDGGSS